MRKDGLSGGTQASPAPRPASQKPAGGWLGADWGLAGGWLGGWLGSGCSGSWGGGRWRNANAKPSPWRPTPSGGLRRFQRMSGRTRGALSRQEGRGGEWLRAVWDTPRPLVLGAEALAGGRPFLAAIRRGGGSISVIQGQCRMAPLLMREVARVDRAVSRNSAPKGGSTAGNEMAGQMNDTKNGTAPLLRDQALFVVR